MTRFSLLVLSLLFASGAWAGDASQENQPYFVSIKGSTAYMREGPSDNHRIKWVYHRKGLPLEVIATFEVWRRVRDMDGEIGWIHMALLSRDRMAVIKGNGEAAVHRRADTKSEAVAMAEPGAMGRLAGCGVSFCDVRFGKAGGWIERTRLWGVHDGEQF